MNQALTHRMILQRTRRTYDVLLWIKQKYDHPKIFITENGFPDSGKLDDNGRITYINGTQY